MDLEAKFYIQLGAEITARRRRLKMKQQAVAARIGVHRNTLMRYEYGDRIPIWTLLRLCDVLCCNYLILLPGRETVWPGGRVEEFNPATPKPPLAEIPVQLERDAPLTAKERRY